MAAGTTTLFTDIVGSTERMVALGDSAWASLLEQHHALARAQLERFGGKEMDTSGDGFFVVFPGVAPAIEAARAIAEALRPLGLTIRAGVHTGDCHVADGKCTGLAVHIGARIVALAAPGEVLATEEARTSAGPGFSFVARGAHELKGVPGLRRLYAADL